MTIEIMHPIYLPFTEDQFKKHCAKVKINGKIKDTYDGHLKYFNKSLDNYKNRPFNESASLKDLRYPCQIEKDERFWTAACLMTIFHSKNRTKELHKLLSKAYPNIQEHIWDEHLSGDLHLYFEANLPSPHEYKQLWLRGHLNQRQFIPYILESDNKRKNLEGPTNVDAVLINADNGFAVVIEAKVLSDISYQTTYDTMRNQIARNIDVMLEPNDNLCSPLNQRDPNKTFFMLLTPRMFKDNPGTRLYGYKINEYMDNPETIKADLPHRNDFDSLRGITIIDGAMNRIN